MIKCPHCGNDKKFVTNVSRVVDVIIDNEHNFIADLKKRVEGYSCKVVKCFDCEEFISLESDLNNIKY